MIRASILLLVLLASCVPGPETVAEEAPKRTAFPTCDIAELDSGRLQTMRRAIRERAQRPGKYLASCFERHDLVLFGEVHQVRETCLFIAESIPALHAAGVRLLATEFLRASQSESAQALVLAEQWDRSAAIALMRELPWPTWGFEEYLGILHAVWRQNRTARTEAQRFLVVGLDSEWSQFENFFGGGGRLAAFQRNLAREKCMGDVLEREAIGARRKALVHIGYAHSVTCHGVRVATVLYKKYGDRVFQVAVHQNFTALPSAKAKRGDLEETRARQSRLTRFMDGILRPGDRGLGFDVLGSELGALTDASCAIGRMLPKFRFEQIAQGYVILKRLADQNPCTWIPGFVDAKHFEAARRIAERMRWIDKGAVRDAASLNAALARRFPGSMH